MDILHLAAPCRNVPVTFTLGRTVILDAMPPAVALQGLARSVYTRIARLALEEKGVPYRLEEVEIFGPDGVPAVHME